MAVHLVLPQRVTRANLVSVTNEATGWTAEKIFAGRKNTYCRSTADNAEWHTNWDAGANARFAIDTVCAFGNFQNLLVRLSDAADYSGATLSQQLSFISSTITSYTVSGPVLTRTDAGTWTRHQLAGQRIKFATSGDMHVVVDNDATRLWTATDLSAVTGNLYTLPGRKWYEATGVKLGRYLGVSVWPTSQQTAEDYFGVNVLLGQRIELPGAHMIEIDQVVDAMDSTDASGGVHRAVIASARREWQLNMAGVDRDLYDEAALRLAALGRSSLGVIPDDTNTYSWGAALPDAAIAWRAKHTRINLIETL